MFDIFSDKDKRQKNNNNNNNSRLCNLSYTSKEMLQFVPKITAFHAMYTINSDAPSDVPSSHTTIYSSSGWCDVYTPSTGLFKQYSLLYWTLGQVTGHKIYIKYTGTWTSGFLLIKRDKVQYGRCKLFFKKGPFIYAMTTHKMYSQIFSLKKKVYNAKQLLPTLVHFSAVILKSTHWKYLRLSVFTHCFLKTWNFFKYMILKWYQLQRTQGKLKYFQKGHTDVNGSLKKKKKSQQ